MCRCERINDTAFPAQYSLYTKIFLYIFLFLLPLGVVESMEYYTVGIQFLVGFTFIMIHNIALSLQTPFENRATDVPIFSISRNIERDLLEVIGEDRIPEEWPVKKGVLM